MQWILLTKEIDFIKRKEIYFASLPGLLSSTDNLCTQFEPTSGPTNIRPDLTSNSVTL